MHPSLKVLSQATLVLLALGLFGLSGAALGKPQTATQVQVGAALFAFGCALVFVATRFSEPGKRKAAGTAIGILGVIVWMMSAIFGPVFASARAASITTTCLSNLKGLSLALATYLYDSNDTYPPADRWLTLSRPYGAEAKHCGRAESPFSYALNENLGGLKLAEIQDVAKTVELFEMNATIPDALGTRRDLVRRHGQGGFFSFCDTHVRHSRDDAEAGLIWKP